MYNPYQKLLHVCINLAVLYRSNQVTGHRLWWLRFGNNINICIYSATTVFLISWTRKHQGKVVMDGNTGSGRESTCVHSPYKVVCFSYRVNDFMWGGVWSCSWRNHLSITGRCTLQAVCASSYAMPLPRADVPMRKDREAYRTVNNLLRLMYHFHSQVSHNHRIIIVQWDHLSFMITQHISHSIFVGAQYSRVDSVNWKHCLQNEIILQNCLLLRSWSMWRSGRQMHTSLPDSDWTILVTTCTCLQERPQANISKVC